MNNQSFVDLKEFHTPYMDALEEAARRVVRSGVYLRGPETHALEKALTDTLGCAYAVACSNGLDAIKLILAAYLELQLLKPGDKVVVPANTYIASILPVTQLGLTPVLVEPDPISMNLDLKKADEIITSCADSQHPIKAVMIVHLYGNPCWDMDICKRWSDRGILIIEDNAQAIGAQSADKGLFKSRYTGALGHAAANSFYPTKNIGALGDAGAVTTSDPQLADTVRALANYGSDTRYHNIFCGYNCRIDEIQAALLNVILPHLPEITSSRNKIADIYSSQIKHPDIILPSHNPDDICAWHQYVIRTPRREELRKYLLSHGIPTDIHYAVPPHLQPCYKKILPPSFPITEEIADSVISLPIHNVSENDAIFIADTINKF